MSQLCLIHFRMWLLPVATSLHCLVFYLHNESLKWTVLLQGSVFSLSAWLMTVLIHTQCIAVLQTWFQHDPTYLNAKLRCGGLILHSSECGISLSFLFLWINSCCWKQKHAQSHSVSLFIFMEHTYIKYAVTFHFPVEFQIYKKWSSISCTLKDMCHENKCNGQHKLMFKHLGFE
jgi:hypothetical protein